MRQALRNELYYYYGFKRKINNICLKDFILEMSQYLGVTISTVATIEIARNAGTQTKPILTVSYGLRNYFSAKRKRTHNENSECAI